MSYIIKERKITTHQSTGCSCHRVFRVAWWLFLLCGLIQTHSQWELCSCMSFVTVTLVVICSSKYIWNTEKLYQIIFKRYSYCLSLKRKKPPTDPLTETGSLLITLQRKLGEGQGLSHNQWAFILPLPDLEEPSISKHMENDCQEDLQTHLISPNSW